MDAEPIASSDAAHPERLVLPIGRDFGAARPGGAARAEATRLVGLGTRTLELTGSQFTVWTLAHGTPDAVRSGMPWHLGSILELARAAGLGDVQPQVETLMGRGLLVELDPASDLAARFARTHRLVPTMLGLGNTAENPSMFGIGFLGQPVIDVDFATYDLWQWSLMDDTLWDACRSATDVVADLPGASHLEPGKLLTEFLRTTPTLVFARAAYFDLAFRLRRPVTRKNVA